MQDSQKENLKVEIGKGVRTIAISEDFGFIAIDIVHVKEIQYRQCLNPKGLFCKSQDFSVYSC